MSYGWLTESALLPTKKKQIDLDSKTFIDLKVNLVKEKEKLGLAKNVKLNESKINNASKGAIKFKNQLPQTQKFNENKKGIVKTELLEEPNYDDIRTQLEIKQNLYDKLKSSDPALLNSGEDYLEKLKDNILFDFENTNYDYQKIKKKQNKNDNEIIPFDKHENTMLNFDTNEQNSVKESFCGLKENFPHINEFEDIKIDSEGNIIKEKVLVKQSFDKILTRDEKEALVVVKDEEKNYKQNLDMLKKKREKEREERLERLKKMKIN